MHQDVLGGDGSFLSALSRLASEKHSPNKEKGRQDAAFMDNSVLYIKCIYIKYLSDNLPVTPES